MFSALDMWIGFRAGWRTKKVVRKSCDVLLGNVDEIL